VLAERYSINPKTVSKWKQREIVGELKNGPKEAHSTVLTAEEEDVIAAFRRYTLLPLDDCLHSL
jgi:transposase-like protein